MLDAKFKAKIQKLVDIRLRVETQIDDFSKSASTLKGEKLDHFIYEISFILEQLEEFKSFHAYDLLEKISHVFGQVKSKELRFNNRLHSILSHIFKISLQQITIIQNIIENKIIAEETIDLLEGELSAKTGIFKRKSKELKLPALTFSLGENVMDIINIEKRNIISESPGQMNLALDVEKFDELSTAYSDIVKIKNELISEKNIHASGLDEKINKFSHLYEQLNLIPVNVYLEKIVQQAQELVAVRGKRIQLSSFWGNSHFPYFKLESLESFSSLLLELLIDYDFDLQQMKNYIEIKTEFKKKTLEFKVKFNQELPSFFNQAKDADDHRIEKFHILLAKLQGELTVNSIEEYLTEMVFQFPIKDEIHTAFLVEYEQNRVFVLQEDIEEVIVIEPSAFSYENGAELFMYQGNLIPFQSLNKQITPVQKCEVGIVYSGHGNTILIGVDQILKKEQISIPLSSTKSSEDEVQFLLYGDDKIEVLRIKTNKTLSRAA